MHDINAIQALVGWRSASLEAQSYNNHIIQALVGWRSASLAAQLWPRLCRLQLGEYYSLLVDEPSRSTTESADDARAPGAKGASGSEAASAERSSGGFASAERSVAAACGEASLSRLAGAAHEGGGMGSGGRGSSLERVSQESSSVTRANAPLLEQPWAALWLTLAYAEEEAVWASMREGGTVEDYQSRLRRGVERLLDEQAAAVKHSTRASRVHTESLTEPPSRTGSSAVLRPAELSSLPYGPMKQSPVFRRMSLEPGFAPAAAAAAPAAPDAAPGGAIVAPTDHVNVS